MRLLAILSLLCITVSSYSQRPPVPNLPFASLEEAGLNRDSMNALIAEIDNFPQRNFIGLVVIKDNQLATEWYFNSFWRNHIHDIRSSGKSITSLLLGVAIKEGLVQSIDQDVYSFFPQEKYPRLHKDYKKVKIKDLLDMSSGLDADSDDGNTPGHAGQWIGKDEWLTYILGIPQTGTPGEKWVYADINAALIGAIIEEKSGMSLRDYAKEKVFDPLGITQFYWYTNAANQTVAAGNLYISTLAFAKLGSLVANQGKWGDQQIVDAAYIERLLTHKVFDFPEGWRADHYGMLWYKSQRKFGEKEVEYLWASGFGGNHLLVVPVEKMVIAITSAGYGLRSAHARSYRIFSKLMNALD